MNSSCVKLLKMRRFQPILVTIAALLFSLKPATLAAGDTAFRFRLQADPDTLDWTHAHTNYETYVLMNIMEGLVEIDKSLQPAPALAEKWGVASDGKTYTFTLRPGVKWSDGVPLKAQDFIYSWKRLLTPGNKNEYTNFLFDVENAEAFYRGKIKKFQDVGVLALDDQHLQVKLRRISPYFLTLLSFWVTFPQRQDLIEKAKSTWTSPSKLVTLGPYRVAKWERGKEITFERNPTYYGPQAPVSKIQALIEPSDAKARQMLGQRKIDALLEVSTQDVAKYTTDPDPSKGWRLKQFSYLATVYLAFNVSSGPTANLSFRKALALALDRDSIPAVLQGGQVSADSLIPKGTAGYDPGADLDFSPDEARKMLLAAKYDTPQAAALTILSRKGSQEDAARYVSEILRRNLGVRVESKAVEPTDFKKALKSGKFNMYIGLWGADYPDPSSFMEIMRSESANNYTHWKNARYDTLVKTAGESLKVLDRLQLYNEAQKILMQEDVVLVPLYYPKLTALVANSVAEFEISPLNYLFFKRIVINEK